MEMEEAATGKGGKPETSGGAGRRAAGDASFVTNPDGTRTYSKASLSLSLCARASTCDT